MKLYFLLLTFCMSFQFAMADWKIDMSRRTKDLRKQEYTQPKEAKKDESIIDMLFKSDTMAPVQEIVVMNTEAGFVPSTVRVMEGNSYKIHVVNVNEKEKNVSFVMDSFSEHHATYYGRIKTFTISPKKEGVYSYQCPETSAQGQIVVYPVKTRHPASEE